MHATVHAVFAETTRTRPGNDFLCVPARADRDWSPAGLTIEYAAAGAEVDRLSERYAAAGYGHGHRVALLLENRPELLLHFLALNALGVSIVPINPDYRHDEMLYLVEHSEADLIVTLAHRRADLAAVAAAAAKRPAVVDVHHTPANLPRPSAAAPVAGPPGLPTECALLYTSGTTGRPKGCILDNLYFLTAGQGYVDHGGVIAIRPGEERFYNPLPLFHMNHLAVTATCAMLSANCLVLPERFSPARWWPEIAATGATIVHYLGVVVPMLMTQPPSPDERRHRVRFGLGAGCEPQLHAKFERRFGFPLCEVWGMTETGRITVDNREPRRIDTRAFGRPFPGLEARVVDEEDREVPRGSDGELVVRHSAATPRLGFFRGYLKNDAATEEAWRGGWFHTGDIVRQDLSGMLYFVDRKKHIIRRSGENISAAEVEAVLQAHEKVAQVAVVAAPDEVREQEVMACVVPKSGSGDAALAGELFDWCNGRLAYFKAPGWFLFLDRLPTTGTQKVQKTQIFASGEDPRRRPDAIDLRARKKRR